MNAWRAGRAPRISVSACRSLACLPDVLHNAVSRLSCLHSPATAVVCLCIRSLSCSFSQRHTVQGIAGAMREGGGGGGGGEPSRRSAIVKSHIIKHKVALLPLLQLLRLSVYFHQCVWVGGGGEMVGKEGSEREERGRSGSRHVSGR